MSLTFFILFKKIDSHFFFPDIYYIPINILSLDTVDVTECDLMLRITTLWFSESISPLSETDDEVHNMSMHNA